VGLHQCRSEKNGQGVPVRALHVPSRVPVTRRPPPNSGAFRRQPRGSLLRQTRRWREMDSNPRSPVSGAVTFWLSMCRLSSAKDRTPLVRAKRPISRVSEQFLHPGGTERSPFPLSVSHQRTVGLRGNSPCRKACASRPGAEIGAIRLVRVWHRMFNSGTISGGTG